MINVSYILTRKIRKELFRRDFFPEIGTDLYKWNYNLACFLKELTECSVKYRVFFCFVTIHDDFQLSYN